MHVDKLVGIQSGHNITKSNRKMTKITMTLSLTLSGSVESSHATDLWFSDVPMSLRGHKASTQKYNMKFSQHASILFAKNDI